jgi:hypothetical protein
MSQAMNNDRNPFDPQLPQRDSPGSVDSNPDSTVRTAVYNKCQQQWLRRVEDQEKELTDFKAAYQQFKEPLLLIKR